MSGSASRVEVDRLVPEGLGTDEAQRRLANVGFNELPRARRRGAARIVLEVLREPMFLLLAVAAALYLVVGGIGEGLMMAAFAALSILLVVVQEGRSEHALEALRALAAPMARVLRDGSERRIAARDVVPGDWLLVADGERVAADGVLVRAEGLAVDESLLTGESVPVTKHAACAAESSAGVDDCRVFAGTLVTGGRGVVEVEQTGARTQAGRIGASLASIELEPTRLQRSFGRIVRLFATVAAVASVAIVLLYGMLRGEWLNGVLSGIAFGMSALPEEFPMVLAVFTAIGAHRLAQSRVLVRRTAVIEMLGACSVLCVDKTGTLTENRMRVASLTVDGCWHEMGSDDRALSPELGRLVEAAARASARTSNDPMDRALQTLSARACATPSPSAQLLREYGLTPERPAVIRIWADDDGSTSAFAKGAPETILALVGATTELRARVLAWVEAEASRGARVLAVASAVLAEGSPPDDPARLPLVLQGLVAFADPLREGARDAIEAARDAGVSVAMITGDHPATALAIAREAGIATAGGVVTGSQIAAADDAGLKLLASRARVFARVRPEQKLRLMQAFRDLGEVVAMTGDGVNDAPALKAAHIGLAMGRHGTDVAREAASIVLLDDDLRHLVAGIATGRRIFDNLRKASMYIAAIHVPIAGLALLPLIAGLPPLLLPLHVVLIEMVIDPVCAIAFEREPAEPDAMRQAPRDARELLIGWRQLAVAGFQGSLLLGACLAIYASALARMEADTARTLAFIAFTSGNLALIRVLGTRKAGLSWLIAARHAVHWLLASIATAVTAACVLVPALARVFRFGVPTLAETALAVAAGLGAALIADFVKRLPGVQRLLGATQRDGRPREVPRESAVRI